MRAVQYDPDYPSLVVRLRAAGCVFAEDEAALLVDAADGAERERLIARRIAGEPLESVLGWAEFFGIRVGVEPGVFVPRRRTELVVREALASAPGASVVVDLCCGTGAVGLAIATQLGDVELAATDIEPAAVRCARANLRRVDGTVFEGDLFAPLPRNLRGRVDVLAVNAPYVPSAEIAFMPREARSAEPMVTLDGGADGLDVHRALAREAAFWLAPGGVLVLETSREQAEETEAILQRGALSTRVARADDIDGTVVVGTRER
jgi:release factor glutamine methyltransferase